jgi:hypothetical protein
MEALRAKYKAEMKGVPQSEWNTPENSAKWQKMYQAMRDSPSYKQHMEDYERIQKDINRYVKPAAQGQGPPGDPAASHGFVWLFRRR